MDKKDELRFQLLIKEYECVHQKMRDAYILANSFLPLISTVIAVCLTIGLKEGYKILILLSPVAVLGIGIITLNIWIELFALGGYKRFLEEELNNIFNEDLMLWEGRISPNALHNNWAHIFVISFHTVIIGSLIWFSLVTAFTAYPLKLAIGLLSIIVFFATGYVLLMVKARKWHGKVYSTAKNSTRASSLLDQS